MEIGTKVKTLSRPGQVGELVNEMHGLFKVLWPDNTVSFQEPDELEEVE